MPITRSSSSTSPPACLEAVVESENSNLDQEGGKKALLDPGAPPTWILVTMRQSPKKLREGVGAKALGPGSLCPGEAVATEID